MMEAHQLVEMKYILFLVVVVHPNFLWVFGLCKLSKTFILFFLQVFVSYLSNDFCNCGGLQSFEMSSNKPEIWQNMKKKILV